MVNGPNQPDPSYRSTDPKDTGGRSAHRVDWRLDHPDARLSLAQAQSDSPSLQNQAWWAFYACFFERLYRFGLRCTRGNDAYARDAAEYAVSHTWESMQSGEFTPDGEREFERELYKRCREQAAKLCRKPSHSKRPITLVSFEEFYARSDDTGASIPDELVDAVTPDQALEDKIGLDIILEEIQRLPKMQQVCVHLHDVRGFEVGEIARRLGKAESTIRVQLANGRRRLCRALLERQRREK